jgi:biopolymer transport protein ExbB
MNNLINQIFNGGLLVYPLILCGLVGIFISIERFVFWAKLSSKYSTHDVEHVYTLMAHKQFEDAKELLEGSSDPSLICLKHCIASKGRIHIQILQSLAQQKLDQARKFMRALETVTTVSPLLGILGTVMGIITSMTSLTPDIGMAIDSKNMIAGLSEALITTALGLIVSITCLIIYGHFMTKWEALRSKLERDLSAFESLV